MSVSTEGSMERCQFKIFYNDEKPALFDDPNKVKDFIDNHLEERGDEVDTVLVIAALATKYYFTTAGNEYRIEVELE